jgi:hypothetical protein
MIWPMNIQSLRSKAIVLLRRTLRAIYARRLRKLPELRMLLKSFEDSDSAAVDTADALAIYEAVITNKPQCLLELGPGTSSAVIALAIAELQKADSAYRPRFIAIEENEQWLSYHETKFPAALRGLVEMIHRPTAGKDLNGAKVAHYLDIPVLPYDFIHVDGPDHLKYGAAIGSDLVDLAPALAPSCYVIFDGRQASARFAIKHLPQADARHHPYSLNFEMRLAHG